MSVFWNVILSEIRICLSCDLPENNERMVTPTVDRYHAEMVHSEMIFQRWPQPDSGNVTYCPVGSSHMRVTSFSTTTGTEMVSGTSFVLNIGISSFVNSSL